MGVGNQRLGFAEFHRGSEDGVPVHRLWWASATGAGARSLWRCLFLGLGPAAAEVSGIVPGMVQPPLGRATAVLGDDLMPERLGELLVNDDELLIAVREQRAKISMTVPVEQVIRRGRTVRARRWIAVITATVAVVAVAAFAVTALIASRWPGWG
jgi:hypothetical protein